MARSRIAISVERLNSGGYHLTGYVEEPEASSLDILNANTYRKTYWYYSLKDAKRMFRDYVKEEERKLRLHWWER